MSGINTDPENPHHDKEKEKDKKAEEEDTEEQKRKLLKETKGKLDYYTKRSAAQVLEHLNVNGERGLSLEEAQERLLQHGPNKLAEDPPTPIWRMFLDQFSDLLVLMLIAASIFSGILGEYAACVVIITIVIANAILGVVQESRAGAALAALRSYSAPHAVVIRDGGKRMEIDSKDVVVGDVVLLENGRKVPADVRLIEAHDMSSNEAALTGESEPAKKNAEYVAEDSTDMPSRTNSDDKKSARKKEEKKEESLTEPNMVYMGCEIMDGYGKGVVIATGMKTKMGEIAHLLKSADDDDSPLTKKLDQLGVRLGLASISASIIVFIIGMTTGRGSDPNSSQPRWLQMLLIAVSLTVAAVPEGLPACVTITLAIGMNRMVEKQTVVDSLPSVETLGSASVICSDKTGTLTTGVMTAVRLWFSGSCFFITTESGDPFAGSIVPESTDIRDQDQVREAGARSKQGPQNAVLSAAMLCSNAQFSFNEKKNAMEVVGNSSERPIIVAGKKAGIEVEELKTNFARVKENPFNSTRKSMSVLLKSTGTPARFLPNAPYLIVAKGAPNVLLERCKYTLARDGASVVPLDDRERQMISDAVDDFSRQAFRVLAVAARACESAPTDTAADALERDLVFFGLIASIDPPRLEVRGSIEKAGNAGVRVVMITGDYVKTAKAIAEQIGLLKKNGAEDKAIDCQMIRDIAVQIESVQQALKDDNTQKKEKPRLRAEEKKLKEELDRITAHADVYARAKPADKLIIVQSLQRQGHVCSMTGDGVNDAPALKQANIGVAMGKSGTDVAKAAADMVLMDDNFCNIVEAIEQGRTIYSNISKFIFYLLSTNLGEILLILIAACAGFESPLTPIQILWLNLTTDGAPAIALAVEETEPGTMDMGPRMQSEPLLDKVMLVGIAVQAMLLTALCFVVYITGLYWHTGYWDGAQGKYKPGTPEGIMVADGTRKASTMTIYYIVFAELLRAYSARSQRVSIFSMGIFGNRWMQWAVGIAISATLFVGHVPGLMGVFELEYLDGRSWGLLLGLCTIPFFVDELTKVVYRYTKFGERPKVRDMQSIMRASGRVHPIVDE